MIKDELYKFTFPTHFNSLYKSMWLKAAFILKELGNYSESITTDHLFFE